MFARGWGGGFGSGAGVVSADRGADVGEQAEWLPSSALAEADSGESAAVIGAQPVVIEATAGEMQWKQPTLHKGIKVFFVRAIINGFGGIKISRHETHERGQPDPQLYTSVDSQTPFISQ